MTEHEKFRADLGAYLLGALSAEERVALEAHLEGCAGCRAERDDLLPVAGMLGDLRRSAPQAARAEPVPAGLDARVLTRLEREGAHELRTAWARRAGLAVLAGAAAAAVLVLGLAITDDGPAEVAVPTEPVELVVSDDDVDADAALINHTWGVEVRLTASGFDDGRRYRVVIVGTDGRRHPAGAFVGVGGREMVCNLNSAVLRPDASGFEVRDRRGVVVVSSRFDGP